MRVPKAAKIYFAKIGAIGGKKNTPAQQAARAANGKNGGRPRKPACA